MSALSIPPSMPFPQLDAAIAKVKAAAPEFVKLSIDEKIALLERMRHGYREIAEESVRLSCQAKGIDFDSPTSGEEWLGGPMVTIRVLRLTEEALREVKQYGAPRIKPSDIRDLPDGVRLRDHARPRPRRRHPRLAQLRVAPERTTQRAVQGQRRHPWHRQRGAW